MSTTEGVTPKVETQMIKSNGTQLILPKARTEAAKGVIANIERFRQPLSSLVDHEQFLHALVVAANEVDRECSAVSVLEAAYNSCRVGLPPGKAQGLAYFIVYKGVCTFVPGYRGFITLAYQNNFLKQLHSEVILKGEDFKQWTDDDGPHVQHTIPIDREVTPANIVGAYTVYRNRNGGRGVCVMNRKQIDKVKKDTPPWRDNFDEMAMKTTIRRAAKRMQLTPQMALAVQLDEQADRDERQDCDTTFSDAPAGNLPSYDDFDDRQPGDETDAERDARLAAANEAYEREMQGADKI